MDILGGNDSIESAGSIQFSETLTKDRVSDNGIDSVDSIESSSGGHYIQLFASDGKESTRRVQESILRFRPSSRA